MTIKHTGKNISAESENIITNVTFNDATGVLTFYQKNLYNGNTTSFSRDLSGVQLGVVKLADQNALNTLKNDSTKEDYKKTHLFLVPLSGNNTEGVFAEYVYVETSTNVWDFERLGSTELDLSDYINTAGSGLSKSGTVLNHTLQMKSENILEVDDKLIPTGKFTDVEGTAFDLFPSWVGEGDAWQLRYRIKTVGMCTGTTIDPVTAQASKQYATMSPDDTS